IILIVSSSCSTKTRTTTRCLRNPIARYRSSPYASRLSTPPTVAIQILLEHPQNQARVFEGSLRSFLRPTQISHAEFILSHRLTTALSVESVVPQRPDRIDSGRARRRIQRSQD